jgi:hypothetical protein
MTEPLPIQLIYVSNSSHFNNEDDLQELLKISRKNNAKLGITGMLLFHDGLFLQILEGPEPSVMALYEKIKLNPKHRACRVLAKLEVKNREFGQWAMAYQKAEGNLALGFSQFMNNYMDYDPARLESESYGLMLKFRQKALAASAA